MKACSVESKAARIAQEHDVSALGTAADVAREVLGGASQGVVDSALDVGEVAGGTHVGGDVDGAPVATDEFQHPEGRACCTLRIMSLAMTLRFSFMPCVLGSCT